jgi:hypothetical protein
MRNKSIKTFGAPALLVIAASCSATEPVEGPVPQVSSPEVAKQADLAVIADKVGQAETGLTPLAWANPLTGSAGVIEQATRKADGTSCRTFVSTEHTIGGATAQLVGLACPTGNSHWKFARSIN